MITLTITAPGDQFLVFGPGSFIRVQSAPTITGPFTDIADPIVPLVSGQSIYVIQDAAGSETTWYRTRYESADALLISSWSDPHNGAPPARRALRYLTPTRYRSMALGIDLSQKSDADLLSVINIATQMVNRETNAPRNHDFRGGSVQNEAHSWSPGNTHEPGQFKIYPFHYPIKSVSHMDIQLTNTQQITFDTPGALYVHPVEHYVEPIAAANTTALFFSVPPYGLRVPVSHVSYDYGESFPIEDEPLTTISSSTGPALQALSQFWDPSIPPVVRKNGVVVDGSAYTVDYTEGIIHPTTPPIVGDAWTADFTNTLDPDITAAMGVIVSDLLGFANINSSGLTGLSMIKVAEIQLKQGIGIGFATFPVHPAAELLLASHRFMGFG
jgi:hypothetical protein